MRKPLAVLLALAALPSARAETVPMVPEPVAILAHLVESRDKKDMGRVVDVLVDHDGQPRAAVLDVGGFLGVGTRKVVVAWSALHFSATGNGDLAIAIDIPSERIKAAPAYEPGKPVKALTSDTPD